MDQPHALIIDDNSKNVNVLAHLLAKSGLTTTQVTNPLRMEAIIEGIEAVAIVFLDLEMPGLNGYEILEKLKSDERFQYTPIVAYTVHVSEINAAKQMGFDGFIAKPLDPDRFPDQLARILNGEKVWEAA